MTWTRRQFGLWTSAALLVSHRALAGEPEAVQQATAPPEPPQERSGFDALELSAKLEANEARRMRVTLEVRNAGAKGQTFHYELVGAFLVDASGATIDIGAGVPDVADGTLAYFEQRHPYARRRLVPSYVDVAPRKSVALEAVRIDLPEKRAAASMLRLQVGLYHDLGTLSRTVTVELPWPGSPKA